MRDHRKVTNISKSRSRSGRSGSTAKGAFSITKAFVAAVVLGGIVGFWWGKTEGQKVDADSIATQVFGTLLEEAKRLLPVQEAPVAQADKSATKESKRPSEGSFSCVNPRIIDGDTFVCDGARVRLTGIDSPEKEGRCRPGRVCAPGDPVASTDNLRKLVQGNRVICEKTDTDRYGRTVARCTAGGTDLSCAQVEGGHAILRYAPISC